jgi:CLIP-associating protein 1/2
MSVASSSSLTRALTVWTLQIPEPDTVIQAFKACLRISNQHLQTATLSALPLLLPLVISHGHARPAPAADILSTSSAGSASVDMYVLRQVLNAFLPQGGVIDRLGDARERPREKAREALVLIGGYAFRAGAGSALGRSRDGKNESPLQVFERFVRESALASKVWRIRDQVRASVPGPPHACARASNTLAPQTLLALVDIRRAHHLFPIRPYLPLLVGTLEDSDANVRDTARTAIVKLFTGPGVTDGARADLKKELTKKGVRKTIVDGVLERIISRSMSAAADAPVDANGDAPRPYVPPSLALQARKNGGGDDAPPRLAPSASRSVSMSSVASRQAGSSRIVASDGASIPGTPTAETTAEVHTVYVRHSLNLLAVLFELGEGGVEPRSRSRVDQHVQSIRGMIARLLPAGVPIRMFCRERRPSTTGHRATVPLRE